ncbi:Ldh family oxidoreductase [Phytohabitans suffuscus]|nr:Ldh family oxidoreductase [Phytohabitans suffuscus]
MPVVAADEVLRLLRAVYESRGVPPDEARAVAAHQVGANLAGHDSHGVIRTPDYVRRIEKGDIVPGAPFEVERETGSTAVVNGNWGFGFVQTERAMRLAVAKARAHGVAAVTIRYQGHMGRLGAYAELAAAEGMISLITADSGRGPKAVVPYGGTSPRLGTNPICFGVPTGTFPLVLDMATSAVAGGKVAVHRNTGEPLPPGLLLDARGRPSTDPADYFAGGALLPMGGAQAHKGFGLSVVVEVLCGLLTGLGFGVAEDARHNDGNFIALFDVARFRDPREFTADVDAFVAFLKDTPLAAGHDEILVPGELEARTTATRRASGLDLDDRTWHDLLALLPEAPA